MKPLPDRTTARLLLPSLVVLGLSGCWAQGTLEDELADVVLATWASEGVTFLGNVGPNSISTVEDTGARTRTITYSDPEALGGEVPFQRVAVLENRGAESSPVWVFEQESRNRTLLWQSTKLTYDFLMTRDERVMDCAVDVDGTSPREIRRDCAIQVMEMEFGQGG